ncbi:MAG: 3-keto-5-aminohexanoate cleavage protein, partial [Mesorhizobium sp.]
STWTAAGIGRNQTIVMQWALARAADAVRTGLEDNIRITRERLARSNAELVERAAASVEKFGRRVATVNEARMLACAVGARKRPKRLNVSQVSLISVEKSRCMPAMTIASISS